ncbi:DUF6993 domain-containing protein [Microcella sp.]|uniref:DUF6993 domain-containing protein n=1 Tax=Microcella sp. TaxID=1913979 RepID=UPI00299F7C19|nr:hypothetical protein [Microcella sp.]MDX2026271.1 hypothetical protein [Microcella sp.]
MVAYGDRDAELVMGEVPVARQRVTLAAVVVAMSLMLSGCVAPTEMPRPTTSSSRTASPTPTPTVAPERVEGGTAGQNRPYVEYVMARLISVSPQMTSLEIADTLVAAGFDRAALQVTDHATRVGSRADSILFSILIDGQCLLGQVADGAVTTSVGDVLGTGKCLVGRTVSLD